MVVRGQMVPDQVEHALNGLIKVFGERFQVVSNKVGSAGFAAVRMAYRYPWRIGGWGTACVGLGAGLQASAGRPVSESLVLSFVDFMLRGIRASAMPRAPGIT